MCGPCVLSGLCHAAGPKSKALISGIGLEELNELAKPPEPQKPEAEVQSLLLHMHHMQLQICSRQHELVAV